MKIVHIKWVDSCSIHRWRLHDEIEAFAKEPVETCETVGFVVHDCKESVTVVQNIGSDCKGEAIKIPRIAIKSIKTIAK